MVFKKVYDSVRGKVLYNIFPWDETESTSYVGHHLAYCGAIDGVIGREIEVLIASNSI
jgi:hypothetical protein